jgi:hypothetical protein
LHDVHNNLLGVCNSKPKVQHLPCCASYLAYATLNLKFSTCLAVFPIGETPTQKKLLKFTTEFVEMFHNSMNLKVAENRH